MSQTLGTHVQVPVEPPPVPSQWDAGLQALAEAASMVDTAEVAPTEHRRTVETSSGNSILWDQVQPHPFMIEAIVMVLFATEVAAGRGCNPKIPEQRLRQAMHDLATLFPEVGLNAAGWARLMTNPVVRRQFLRSLRATRDKYRATVATGHSTSPVTDMNTT